jgi:hypothetical protein
VANKLAQPGGNGEWVRGSWSDASLARPMQSALSAETLRRSPRPSAGSPYGLPTHLEVPVPLDMPLADNFPAAVDEVKFAEFVVLVFEIDGPIATSGSGGIGAPG